MPAPDTSARRTALGPRKGLSARPEALSQSRAGTFPSAPGPQHPPPPPPDCSGAASRGEPAREMKGRARGRGRQSRAAAEAAEGFRAARRTGAACSHSWPRPRRLRSPTVLHEPSRHAKYRTPRSVAPPGRFGPARSQEPQQQNGGRGRSGRPPPPSLSALRLRTRGLRLPAAAGTLPVTSHGAANQERGRDGLGVRRSLQLPRSGRRWSRQRWRRALPSWAAVRRRGRCRRRVSPR